MAGTARGAGSRTFAAHEAQVPIVPGLGLPGADAGSGSHAGSRLRGPPQTSNEMASNQMASNEMASNENGPHRSGPLGILAGGSGVPLEIADAVTRCGRAVHIVGLEGEADAGIARFSHTWVNWGGVGAILAAFKASGCREIVIVGRVRRPNLTSLRPDLGFWTSLPLLLGVLRGGDDAILRTVVGFFERHGLTVVGAHEAAPELVARAGQLGARAPSRDCLAGIATATAALAALGPFDAAQAAVARGTTLLAVEGADGTDAMLQRLSALARQRRSAVRPDGAVLVKLPKPQQERRIDLPAIGPDTVRRALEAGLAGIAVRADATLIAERVEAIRLADASGLFVQGLGEDSRPAGAEPADAPTAALDGLKPVGRYRPGASALADARLGTRVVAALEPFWERSSALVSRGYVLAAERQGGAQAAVERAARLKPWGARLLRAKVGVLVMTDIAGELGFDPRVLALRAKASGLAGLVVLRAPMDERALAQLATAVDEAGLFLLAPGCAL